MRSRNLILLVAITGILFIANAPSVSADGKGYGGGGGGHGGGHGGGGGGHGGGCPPGLYKNGRCGGPVIVVPQPVVIPQPVYVAPVYRGGHGGGRGDGHGDDGRKGSSKGYGHRHLLKN